MHARGHCACVCTQGPGLDVCGIFLGLSPFSILRQGLSLILELTSSARLARGSGIWLCLPSTRVTAVLHSALLSPGCQRSEQGPHACTANTPPSHLPNPHSVLLMVSCYPIEWIYNWPCVFKDSTSTDSTTHGCKIYFCYFYRHLIMRPWRWLTR